MKQLSLKQLNLNLLSTMANSLDGYVFLLTNFGHVMGRLYYAGDQLDDTLAGMITKAKEEILNNIQEEIEFIGDGSLICIKDAIITYTTGQTLSFDEMTLHADQIVGFSPIDSDTYTAYMEEN